MNPDAQNLLSTFQLNKSWEQKMRLLMQLGRNLSPLTEIEKTDNNQVKGCESQVWLVSTKQDNQWHFKATSDARLIQGLLAVLLTRVNGLTAKEIKEIDLDDWFQQLGLGKQLSSSRRNGLNAIFQKIKTVTEQT